MLLPVTGIVKVHVALAAKLEPQLCVTAPKMLLVVLEIPLTLMAACVAELVSVAVQDPVWPYESAGQLRLLKAPFAGSTTVNAALVLLLIAIELSDNA